MASALEEAFASVLIADIANPLGGVMPKMADQYLEKGDLAMDQVRIERMLQLSEIIAQLQSKQNHNVKVVASFQRMLDKYTAKQ